MLSTTQIDHFRTFGFLALPGLLVDALTGALRAEVESALRDAFSDTYDTRVVDGISGHYLPMASRLTPISASLVCDNPILMDIAEQILGTRVLPSIPEGVLYFADAGWHDDDGIGVRGVKFAAYFEHLDATNGALRFVPCSQHADAKTILRAYQRAGHDAYPSIVVDTAPGDVVAFDLHTFHASFGGTDRMAWTMEFLAEPTNENEREKTLQWMTGAFEQQFRGFDRRRYPTWHDWQANREHNTRRAVVIDRLRAAGVLDLCGAALGW